MGKYRRPLKYFNEFKPLTMIPPQNIINILASHRLLLIFLFYCFTSCMYIFFQTLKMRIASLFWGRLYSHFIQEPNRLHSIRYFVSKNLIQRPATSEPWEPVKIQNIRLTPDLFQKNLHRNKIPKYFQVNIKV